MVRGALTKDENKQIAALTKVLFPAPYRASLGEDWIRDTLLEDLTPRPTAKGRRGQLKAVFGHDTRRQLAQLSRDSDPYRPAWPGPAHPPQAVRTAARGDRREHPSSASTTLGTAWVRHAGDRLSSPLLAHFASVDGTREDAAA